MSAITYSAPPTIGAFMRSSAYIRALVGPFGSGKSTGCAIELLRRAREQAPSPGDNIRRTRWLIVRNSYPELRDTTRKTFEEWVADPLVAAGAGSWSEAEFTFTARFQDVEADFLFRALDRPEDVKKLLSLELTGAWLNEAREIPRAVFDLVQGRVGRYPAMRQGGPSWHGLIMDTNPPDTDHWFYRLFEENKPENAAIFKQPSGLDPKAENIENLVKDYYKNLMVGKDVEWIKVYIHGQYGFVRDGKPVYPEYNDPIHSVDSNDDPKATVLLGADFGLTPALVFGQRDPRDGQVQILEEMVATDLGAVRFYEEAARYLKTRFKGRPVAGYGDPAGEQRSQVDERTPYDIATSQGIPLGPAPTNDFTLRREAVARALTRLTLLGRPALVISPKCKILRKAMNGGYCLRRIAAAGQTDRFRDVPDKNHFSHVAEALQYLMVGEGEDSRALQGTTERRKVSQPFKVKRALGARRRTG